MKEDNVCIIATGEFLVGNGVRAVQLVIDDLLRNAKEEILISVFQLGESMEIMKTVESAASKGKRVVFVINRLLEHPISVINSLRKLQKEYNNVRVYNFTDKAKNGNLHMKVLVVDRAKAVIGSANLTWCGMVKNQELGVLIEGKEVEKITRIIDNLICESKPLV